MIIRSLRNSAQTLEDYSGAIDFWSTTFSLVLFAAAYGNFGLVAITSSKCQIPRRLRLRTLLCELFLRRGYVGSVQQLYGIDSLG